MAIKTIAAGGDAKALTVLRISFWINYTGKIHKKELSTPVETIKMFYGGRLDKLPDVHYYVHIDRIKIKFKNMNIKTTLPITEARKKIFKITDEAQKPGNYYTLTEKGRPKAVLMSAEEFESWQETMEVMREFPDLDKDVKEVDRAVKTGEYKKWATLDDIMAKYGYIVADKSKTKYGVGNKNRKKSAKRIR
jgi:prevent-host-death family protein